MQLSNYEVVNFWAGKFEMARKIFRHFCVIPWRTNKVFGRRPQNNRGKEG